TISAQQPVSAYNYSEHTLESKTNLQMRVSRLEEAEQLQLHLTHSILSLAIIHQRLYGGTAGCSSGLAASSGIENTSIN
ncbi:MAG: hypothetical protein M1503_11325, partial [Thaumarchaeota archaeon]|nr:hypothetical protein [Nitrososphaerota archaeon]